MGSRLVKDLFNGSSMSWCLQLDPELDFHRNQPFLHRMESSSSKRVDVDLCSCGNTVLEDLPRGHALVGSSVLGLGPVEEIFPRDQILCYVAFMVAKVTIGTTQDDQELPVLKTPDNVDEVWHAHLLHPMEYSDFCHSLGSPHPFPHNEEWANDKSNIAQRIDRTDAQLAALFGNKYRFGWGTDGDMVVGDSETRRPRKRRSTGSSGPGTYYVKTLTDEILTICASGETTIEEFKALIQDMKGIPPCQQRLICNRIQARDEMTLQDLGVLHDGEIHLVLKMRGC